MHRCTTKAASWILGTLAVDTLIGLAFGITKALAFLIWASALAVLYLTLDRYDSILRRAFWLSPDTNLASYKLFSLLCLAAMLAPIIGPSESLLYRAGFPGEARDNRYVTYYQFSDPVAGRYLTIGEFRVHTTPLEPGFWAGTMFEEPGNIQLGSVWFDQPDRPLSPGPMKLSPMEAHWSRGERNLLVQGAFPLTPAQSFYVEYLSDQPVIPFDCRLKSVNEIYGRVCSGDGLKVFSAGPIQPQNKDKPS